MNRVRAHIQVRQTELAEHPFFLRLQSSTQVKETMAFIAAPTFFVMTFQDILRLNASLTRAGSPPLGETIWHDTQIELPSNAPPRWESALTGERLRSPLLVSAMFSTLPLSVSLSL